jgi:hypothetical protein
MLKAHFNFNKALIAKTLVIFLISYIAFAALWVHVKDSYGYTVTLVGSKFAAALKNAQLEDIEQGKDLIHTSFRPLTEKQGMLFPVTIPTYVYTSNVPMTFAIMVSFYLFIGRKIRAYTEAFLILFAIHLLYVFSFENMQLTYAFMKYGIQAPDKLKYTFYQFFWAFTDFMFVRFGAFFIGIYTYLRFIRPEGEEFS